VAVRFLFDPPRSGISVLRELRGPRRDATNELVDVLVITALRDVDNVRAALHSGAVYYLLKPFTLTALRDQLERYAAMRKRITRMDEATQTDVDNVFGLLRATSGTVLPKGLTSATAQLVADALRGADTDLSAVEVAELTGIARVTARRYLEYLCADGRAALHMRYGSAGRPEHRYRWVP
jgi:two-component system CitB family response regulator